MQWFWPLALLLANVPFLSNRLGLIGPKRLPKPWGWRLAEMLVLCALFIVMGMLIEQYKGQRHEQGWQFYATMVCLFLSGAFPGFVWRYLK
jgi:uncharacterized membrane protein SirB2